MCWIFAELILFNNYILINFQDFKIDSFGKNIITLTFGTTIAQILPFVFYPILGRIYNPDEFGFFYGIISVIPILTILSTGMLEHAILIAETEVESNTIIKLILIRSAILLILFAIIGYIIFFFTDILDNYKVYTNWIIVVVLIAFFTVIYNVFNEWSIRLKHFKNLALNKIYNSSLTSISKVFSKYFTFFNNGLIIGEFIGKFFTALISLFSILKFNKKILSPTNINEYKAAYIKYRNFPRFMLPDQLINTIGGSIHVYIIGIYFSALELGYLSMALSLLTVPVTVISAAIKDVFRQKANELYLATGSCRELYVKLFKPIFILGLFLFVSIYFIVPYAFPLFLGDKWVMAGRYAQYLMPLFFLNFVSMSLGGVLIIANQIRVSLYWQIYNATTTIISLLVGALYFKDIIFTLILLMLAKSSSYLIYIILSYNFSKKQVEV